MTTYTIGFRNGHIIQTKVSDGKKLISDYARSLSEMRSVQTAFYADDDTLINLTEIVYLMPSDKIG